MVFGRVHGAFAAALLSGTALIGVAQVPAMAQSRAAAERNFDIAAQPLSTAITSFGQQSGMQVSAPSDLLSGRTASAVSGRMSPLSALGRLLSGTGLSFRVMGNTVVLERAPEVSGDAVSLGPVRVEGSGGGRAVSTLSPSTDPLVTEGSRSYAPLATNVGKAPLKLKEIPQSVTVITRERIETQNLISIEDVMLQTTGVTVDRAWLSSTYRSRGLPISNFRYDGGAVSNRVDGMSDIDTAIYDSIALIRGADGLFGAGEAGGVINFSRKRALDTAQLQLNAFGGSWDNYRGELDVTGPITSDGALRARVIGVIDNGDSFQKYKQDRRALIHGVVEYDLTPSTLIVAGYTHQDDTHLGFNVSLPRYRSGADIGLPRDFNMGAPWNRIDRTMDVAYGRIEQKIGEDWTVRLNANHWRNSDQTNAAEMENAVNADGSGADWWYFQQDKDTRETTIDLSTQGSFQAFGQKHDVILGIDYTKYRQDYQQLWTYVGEANIFNPVIPPRPAFPPAFSYRNRQIVERAGLYGSLRVRPIAALSLIAGGRLTLKDNTRNINLVNGALRNETDQDSVFVPYLGAILDVTPQISLYASMAEIYQSQADQNSGPRPGTPLDPVTGRNYEVGIKGELFDGRLVGSFALYRVNMRGQAVQDPNYPNINGDPCCYLRKGNLQSEGFEIDINGEIVPGWNISLGYTYNDNSNKVDGDIRFSETTPKHLLKLWTNYRFQEGPLKGLVLGGGVTAQSKNFRSSFVQEYNPATGLYDGDYYEYQFNSPGYAIWGARIGYELNDRYSIAVNLNNIFDKTYYLTVDGAGYGNIYGDPRNVLVSVRGKF